MKTDERDFEEWIGLIVTILFIHVERSLELWNETGISTTFGVGLYQFLDV